MKKLINWAWTKAVNFVKWVWRECRNWQTLILLALVCIVVGAPVWVCGLLWLLFGWTWAGVVCAALLAFWWLPGMPYFAVCVSITLVIKRLFGKYKQKQLKAARKAEKAAQEAAAKEASSESKDNNE